MIRRTEERESATEQIGGPQSKGPRATLNRRVFLQAAATASAGAMLTSCASKPSTDAGPSPLPTRAKPNIILIYTDDLDFDDIGGGIYPVDQFPSCTGAHLKGVSPPYTPVPGRVAPFYESTRMHMPALESMAKAGAVFTRFYITSPMCTPSRYSLITGRYASRSATMVEQTPEGEPSWVAWNSYFRPDEPSVARDMKRLGYTTAFIGKTHNGEPEKLHPQWIQNKFADQPDLLADKLKEAQLAAGKYLRDTIGFDVTDRICVGNADKVGGHNLPWYTEGALEFLDKHQRTPFFLYMALPVPHAEALWPHYDQNLLLTPAGKLQKAPNCQPSLEDVRQRLKKEGVSLRSVAVTWIDDALAAILAKLDALGIADNTLVIFTSDHQSRGKSTVYEGCRVPCVMRWPAAIRPGTHVTDICANIDILPTVVDLAGGKPSAATDGLSFRDSMITGQPQRPTRALLLEACYSRAVVKGGWKYIAARPPNYDKVIAEMQRDAEAAKAQGRLAMVGWKGGTERDMWYLRSITHFPWSGSPDQLYNLETDVFEQQNLADEAFCQPRLEDLRRELRGLLSDMPRPFALDLKHSQGPATRGERRP